MTKPTRQDIVNAHTALRDLRDSAMEWVGLPADEQYNTVLAALPHIPKRTMADVEWNDDEHYFAEAEHPDFGNVIMLGPGPVSGDIRITRHRKHGKLWQLVEPDTLTLTGKRYTLKEILD